MSGQTSGWRNLHQYIEEILSMNLTEETLEMFPGEVCQKQISLSVDSLVQLLVLLEKGQDSASKMHGVLYALKCLESQVKGEFLICSLRTSKECLIMTQEKLLQLSSTPWMNWGMTHNGKCLTAKISESHNIEKGCSLSQILEGNPDQKYFLSEEQLERMRKRTRALQENILSNNGEEDTSETTNPKGHQL